MFADVGGISGALRAESPVVSKKNKYNIQIQIIVPLFSHLEKKLSRDNKISMRKHIFKAITSSHHIPKETLKSKWCKNT